MGGRKLTAKQERFVEEYLIDLNATQAAIRAGYSRKTANRTGSENLSKPGIAEAIAKRQKERSERTEIDQDWVLMRLQQNIERAMEAVPVLDSHGNATGVWKYEGAVANKALELLGKHLGMFRDRVELTGADGGPVIQNLQVEFIGTQNDGPNSREV